MNKTKDETKCGPNVSIKRAYESPGPNDGCRILVDRLWPRGIRKTDAFIDEWWKECAPSTALRKWFSHDPAKWDQFKQRYREELELNYEDLAQSVNQVRHRQITLVFAAKDVQHNNAIVLKGFIETRILGTRAS